MSVGYKCLQCVLFVVSIGTLAQETQSVPKISILHPSVSSVVHSTNVIVDFDVDVHEAAAFQVCFRLDRVAQLFEYHMCEALSQFYPSHSAKQQLNLKDLLPGERSITLALATWDGYVVAEASSTFTIVDPQALAHVDFLSLTSRTSSVDRANVFDEVYRIGFWQLGDVNRQARAPASGIGSTLASTELIRHHLHHILTQYGIQSILDVPCGDVSWIPHVDFTNISYIGADISSFVIESNKQRLAEAISSPNHSVLSAMHHSASSISFITLDLVQDQVPDAELIFCRHMMMHLSPQHNLQAIANIEQSNATYLMATTYLYSNDNDSDYTLLLGHRVNLFAPPYCFRDPLLLVKDDSGSNSRDMFMGLWDLRLGALRDEMSPWCMKIET